MTALYSTIASNNHITNLRTASSRQIVDGENLRGTYFLFSIFHFLIKCREEKFTLHGECLSGIFKMPVKCRYVRTFCTTLRDIFGNMMSFQV